MHLQAVGRGLRRLRPVAVHRARRPMVMKFRPGRCRCTTGTRSTHDFLSAGTGDEVRHDLAARQRVLPAGSSTPARCSSRGDEVLPDRLRQRLPRRGADLAALLLPVGDGRAAAMERLLRRHRPSTSDRHRRPAATSRSPTATDLYVPGEAAPATGSLADEYFDTDRYCRVLLDPAEPRRRDGSRLGRARRRLRRPAGLAPSGPRTRPTSGDRFVAHFRGLIGAWLADRA